MKGRAGIKGLVGKLFLAVALTFSGSDSVRAEPSNYKVDAPSGTHYFMDSHRDALVWTEFENGLGDIVVWHPDSGEQKITDDNYDQCSPSMSGNNIVWTDFRNGNPDIYMWDSVNGERPICTDPSRQSNPSIWNNQITWFDDRSGETEVYRAEIEPRFPDLNSDGIVDMGDYAILVGALGNTGFGLPEDLNDDYIVNSGDLGVLARDWLEEVD